MDVFDEEYVSPRIEREPLIDEHGDVVGYTTPLQTKPRVCPTCKRPLTAAPLRYDEE